MTAPCIRGRKLLASSVEVILPAVNSALSHVPYNGFEVENLSSSLSRQFPACVEPGISLRLLSLALP